MLSLASTTGAVEVHSLDYSTVLFVSFDSMRVDGDVKNFFLETDQYLREGTGHANRFVTPPDTT